MRIRLGWAVGLLVLVSSGTGRADATNLGEERLDRGVLMNFEDFEDVSLEELSGSGGKLRFSLNLFGNTSVDFTTPEEQPFAFRLGPLGLLADAELDRQLRALAELAVETDGSGVTVVDLERLMLRWKHYPWTLSAGRLHTPLGYWNTAFHHGRWLQLTIERPGALSFEDDGGLLPVHSIGISASHQFELAGGEVITEVVVANGRGNIPDDITVVRDTNNEKALMFQVKTENIGMHGLRLGAGVLHDRIAAAPAELRPALPDVPIDEWIVNFMLVIRQRLTVIAEYYWIAHQAEGNTFVTHAPYALVGYNFSPLMPYLLLEAQLTSGGADPFFFPETTGVPNDFFRATVGCRLELGAWSALKVELSRRQELNGPAGHEVMLDWSFGI